MALMVNNAQAMGSGLHIPRRATAVRDGQRVSQPLDAWRELDAYVLLGDPGAGKSEALRAEAGRCGGKYISARDFIALGIDAEEADTTLFIDGLDEMRAGSVDGGAPLDAIRARLKAMGCPRFRLSCREHDWRAQTDETALKPVAGGEMQVLHLDPLSRDEQLAVCRAQGVPDPEAFIGRAEKDGLVGLFGNPLLLSLTVRAVLASRGWPGSRHGIYELACRELATERSSAHRDAKPLKPGAIDHLLDDAGLLCAVLLLSGKSAFTRAPEADAASVPWHLLPAQLHLHDPIAARGSKVFVTALDRSTPCHRSVAEYLAARAIAQRLTRGLPLSRVLALMQGGDGGIVEPLRGLLGWLTVHAHRDRARLIRLDPLGVVLNGDVAAFSSADKGALLDALRDEAQRNPWFRNAKWVSHPFAPLASPDLEAALKAVLANHTTEGANQAFVQCVLDALAQGKPLPSMRAAIESWVEDANAQFGNRLRALDAWKRCTGGDPHKALEWLDQLHEGRLTDLDGRLASQLLFNLYPANVGPTVILRYWPKPSALSANTFLPHFWCGGLIRLTPPANFASLADAWLQLQPSAHRPHHDGQWLRLRSDILAKAIAHSGDQVSDERLYAWLGIGLDEHGSSRLDRASGGDQIATWLGQRPTRLKAVVALGWQATAPDPTTGRRYFWGSLERLHGAPLPRDWFHWLLAQAANAPHVELAEYGFAHVARATIDPPAGFDTPTMEQVEDWVSRHAGQWPQAHAWLDAAWTSLLQDSWQSKDLRRQRQHAAEDRARKEARREALAPHLAALTAGAAPAPLLQQLAGAHEGRFFDIQGETPAQRVQDFLVADEATANAVMANLSRVLERDDLPSADEVLHLDANGKHHLLRLPALLAARLAYERKPEVLNTWPDSLQQTLVAFWLTDGSGETPTWYTRTVELRPELVAPLLVRYALPRFRRKGPLSVTGLWALPHEPGHAALARLALPALLAGFPQRASEPARLVLNRYLLGALHWLDEENAAALVRRKIAHPSIDPAQRVGWLVANLPYDDLAAQTLVDAVGANERRAVAAGNALHEQATLNRASLRAQPSTLARLIELLAPITQPDPALGSFLVGAANNRRDTVRQLINSLAASPLSKAADEMRRLLELPRVSPWHEQLRFSLLAQQDVAREAHYVHPSPQAAALTLVNGAPANRADLRALTLAHLGDIANHIRHSDTFALKQYWYGGITGSGQPKDENDCRDLLLLELRGRLTDLGIHVVPERRSANEKRSDMRVEFTVDGECLAVPVEIKKEDHRDLWLAWRHQLQALYTNDPAAAGHGIYLVLWFGHKPRASPEGERPISAENMAQLLSKRIPEADWGHIKGLVMDLSMPS
jgi:hypothetical protein